MPGMVLGIYCGNQTTITPAGSDIIIGGAGPNFTNASPMVIPPTNTNVAIYLVGRAVAWDILSLAPKIADVLGWVSRPYFDGTYPGANFNFSSGTWTKMNLAMNYDSHGWWDAANTRYTPKRAGKYLITYQHPIGDATTFAATTCYAAIWKNGVNSNYKNLGAGPAALPAINPISVTAILPMNGTTDFLEAYIFVIATTPWGAGGSLAEMCITYVGP